MTVPSGTFVYDIKDAGWNLFRFWGASGRKDYTAERFWALVASHIARIDASAHINGVALVIGHTGPDQIALFVALIAAGRLAAIFPPSAKLQDEAAYFTQQRAAFAKIDPAAIYIFEPHLAETIARVDSAFASRVVLVPEETPAHGVDAQAAASRFFERLASPAPIFVQHSSGTTGIKKAVAITGQALAAQYRAYWPALRNAAGAERLRIASWLPLYHDMGLITSLLLPVIGGDCVSITDAFDWIAKPALLFDMIASDGCTACWMPNFAFRHLVRLAPGMERRDVSSVKLWIDCSEPCRMVDTEAFERAFSGWGVPAGSVLGCYAMAETVFAATQAAPGEQRGLAVPHNVLPGADLAAEGARVIDSPAGEEGADKLVLSSGRAVAGMEIAVLAGGAPAAEGIYGEVALRAPFLFEGYRGLTRADSNLRTDGFFLTGDLGALIDGHLYVFGRLKELIIVNGKNLFAGDIEDAMNTVAGVRRGRAVAFGMESAQTGSEELVVVAEHDGEAGVPAAQVRIELSRVVADVFLIKPRDVRVVEDRWLVKSTSGKISRDENRRKYVEAFRSAGKAKAAAVDGVQSGVKAPV